MFQIFDYQGMNDKRLFFFTVIVSSIFVNSEKASVNFIENRPKILQVNQQRLNVLELEQCA